MDVVLDEIDQIIVDGLADYVDVGNAALKDERNQGKFILGGQLKSTPDTVSAYQQALSLGMTALNESNGAPLAADIPDSPINREIYQRLVDHMMGRTKHGLRSALAGMGLDDSAPNREKRVFTDPENKERAARRAADRGMELISGRQRTAGYPITSIPIVGGHQIGRATSLKNEMPEQILFDGNMEVEGALEGQVRHEDRGREASRKATNKLAEFLGTSDLTGPDTLKLIDTLVTIKNSRPRNI